MTAAAQDLTTQKRVHEKVNHPVAAAAKIFALTIVGGTVSGANARPYQVGDLVLGVSQEYVDNTAGAAGAKTVTVEKGCFRFAQNATITRDHIGLFCKPIDDATVAVEATPATATANTCGTIVDLDSTGVWVEFRRYR